MEERLQKILSRHGVASRRKAEDLIAARRVRVNGNTAQLGDTADEQTDVIEVDGVRLKRAAPEHLYMMLNKPRGYVTTLSDEKGRRTVADLVADLPERVYPVGRLDLNSEGLLLLTNDGELANRLMHPKQEIEKVYLLWVSHYAPGAERSLAEPLEIDGRKTSPARVELLRVNLEAPSQTADSRRTESHAERTEKPATALLRITIHEGRNRQIRRLAERAGLTVTRLKRIAEGPLRLGDLAPGQYRPLTDEELELFRKREVKISHNPASAMRVLGFARIPKMLEMGLRPSIGTDGASSSKHMDMVDEMWLTSLIHKGWRLNPTVVPSQDILRMATKWGRGHCLTRNSTAVSRPGRRRISSSSTRTARR